MIYFIQTPGENLIKIGHTARMSVRLGQHRAKYGEPLEILGVMDGGRAVEQQVHARFGHLRDSREELFRPESDLLSYIAASTTVWSKDDEDRCLTVRIDDDLAAMARYVSRQVGLPLTEMLCAWLRPVVEEEFRLAGRDIAAGR